MKDNKRDFVVLVKMTKDEADEIRAAAKSEGMQVAQFIRFAAIRLARQ